MGHSNRSKYFLGICLVVLFIAMSAVREVYFALALRQVSIYVLIPLVFSLTFFFFAATQLKALPRLLAVVRQNFRDFVFLNLTTALAWFSFMFSLSQLEPAIATSIATALGPLATLVLGARMLAHFRVGKNEIICSVGIVISIALLCCLTLGGKSGVKPTTATLALAGLAGAFTSGIASALNNIIAKRLASRGVTAEQIMVGRFHLLIFGCVLCLFFGRISIQMTSERFLELAALSFLGISIPLYLLQMGIARVDATSTALVIACGPLITYVVQGIKGGFGHSLYSLAGICLALGFVTFGIVSKLRQATALRPSD